MTIDPNIWKVIHIVGMVAWMAGLMYLPRLFVYHTETKPKSEEYNRFLLMERRLLYIITTPALFIVWCSGLLLMLAYGLEKMAWLHMKMSLVFFLAVYHGYLIFCHRSFVKEKNKKSAKFFRCINEIPTLILISVVILVVYQP